MNNSNFNQTNGYPLNTERLQELQTTFGIFNSFGSLAGNYTIISGCETNGTTVANGRVFIDGELLDFKTASVTPTSTVIIIETAVFRPFETGPDKQVYTIRHATFGTAETSWPWSDFKRPMETKIIQSVFAGLTERIIALEARPTSYIPIGLIAIWERPANEIPVGWIEHLPLKGRIPIGMDNTKIEFGFLGQEAGETRKTLIVTELPPHSHAIKSDRNEDHDNGSYAIGGGNYNDRTSYTEDTGRGDSFSIMNPYRVVHFIKYVG